MKIKEKLREKLQQMPNVDLRFWRLKMVKIKEFIGTDAMAAVEADGYTAGKMLAEFLQMSHKEVSTNGCIEIAQKLTIEKVGRIYADKLAFITGAAILSNTRSIVLKIATASAHQRIAAMLSALSEIE